MDRLLSMRLFCKVAALSSFSRAAEEFEMSSAVASRLVSDLEQHLRTRLLNRTTRSVKLTEAGLEYFQRCQHILEQIDEADSQASGNEGYATGTLRLLVGFSEGISILSPHLREFHQKYPDVVLDIHLAERPIEIVQEQFDIAIQPEPFVVSSSVVVRELMEAKLILCASPDYLERHPAPVTPAELSEHDCINFSNEELRHSWSLSSSTGTTTVKPRNILLSNNIEPMLSAIRSGMGIGLAFKWLIEGELQIRRLIQVLPDYHTHSISYYIAYTFCKTGAVGKGGIRPFGTGSCRTEAGRHLAGLARVVRERLQIAGIPRHPVTELFEGNQLLPAQAGKCFLFLGGNPPSSSEQGCTLWRQSKSSAGTENRTTVAFARGSAATRHPDSRRNRCKARRIRRQG